MIGTDIASWLDEYDQPGHKWYVKRLAPNDTLETGGHQAGPYLPKRLIFEMFPSQNTTTRKNPDARFDLYIDSHLQHRVARAIYYNNKRTGGGTRDEIHVTNLGGRQSALLDPESTGSLAIFAFTVNPAGDSTACHVWVCDHHTEEDLIEERIGRVDPSEIVAWTPGAGRDAASVAEPARSKCNLTEAELPAAWLEKFPSGEEIIRKTVLLRGATGLKPDTRLIKRRDCEFEIFQSIERAFHQGRILEGFTTLDEFLKVAQAILQSRKSRSGNSLELHLREIFVEEGLRNGETFQYKPVIEGGRRPDFLFPSKAAYDDPTFPASKLRMLAVKTTCKDRWRQVLEEASRIPEKHLLTLQEGVSQAQFNEMRQAGVQLVVPRPLHRKFPPAVQSHLVALESFIGDVRSLTV